MTERPAPPTRSGPSPTRPRLSKHAAIGLGLALTFVGLFLLGALVPPNPSALERTLPVAGAGILTLWVGGVLLGRGSRT